MSAEEQIVPDGYHSTELGPLPEDWQVVRLGEVAWVDWGNTSLTKTIYRAYGYPVFSASGMDGYADFFEHEGEAVIVSAIGARCGKCFYATGKWTAIKNTIIIKAKNSAYNQFLYFYLNDEEKWPRAGSGQPFISLGKAELVPIPLPPLPEQRAIAHVLRTVQQAKESTERVIAALRELKKSLMRHLFTYGPVSLAQADAVSLRETEIGPIPEHWEVVRLGEVVEVKGGKRLPKGDEFSDVPTAYPYIRIVDFENGSVNRSNLKFLTFEQHNLLKRYIIKKEDVYISIAGTIGLVGLIPSDLDGAHLTENAARMILHQDKVDQKFLVFALASDRGQEQIQSRSTKTSQPKLALARIKEIPIPLPPLAEQREIARILQTLDRRIAAEEAYARALGELFQSLLHELMTGQRRVRIVEESAP